MDIHTGRYPLEINRKSVQLFGYGVKFRTLKVAQMKETSQRQDFVEFT